MQLSHGYGNLRPDVVSEIGDPFTSNNPSDFPDREAEFRDFDHLWVIFQKDCATTESEAQNYANEIVSRYSCVVEDHDQTVFYSSAAGQWMAFLLIIDDSDVDVESYGNECIDKDYVNYDDYCIGYLEYEFIAKVDSNYYNNVEWDCAECYVSDTYWNLDFMDGNIGDNYYKHLDTILNLDDVDVDIYILDTGVQSSHIEFLSTNGGVTHLDSSLGISDSSITDNHGTHVAGTASGITVGVSRGFKIYSWLACPSNCPFADVFAGLQAVINNIQTTGRRGVVNLSLSGYYGTSVIAQYYDFLFGDFIDLYNAGGIAVVAAGNDYGLDACGTWPGAGDMVITVGSHDGSGMSIFSNQGSCVDIYAPGSNVYSSIWSISSSIMYGYLSGTSMATPAMTGMIAQLLAVDNSLTFENILEDIIGDSNNHYVLPGYCPSLTSNGIACNAFIYDFCGNNNFEYSCSNILNNDNFCNYSPQVCDCNEVNNCQVCNQGSGCSQCESRYFKRNYDQQCLQCQEIFGDACMHCTDFLGCQQCKDGYTRTYDTECNLWFCK